MFDVKVINSMVQQTLVKIKAMTFGKQRMQIKQVDEKIKNVALNPVKLCTVAKVN